MIRIYIINQLKQIVDQEEINQVHLLKPTKKLQVDLINQQQNEQSNEKKVNQNNKLISYQDSSKFTLHNKNKQSIYQEINLRDIKNECKLKSKNHLIQSPKQCNSIDSIDQQTLNSANLCQTNLQENQQQQSTFSPQNQNLTGISFKKVLLQKPQKKLTSYQFQNELENKFIQDKNSTEESHSRGQNSSPFEGSLLKYQFQNFKPNIKI